MLIDAPRSGSSFLPKATLWGVGKFESIRQKGHSGMSQEPSGVAWGLD
jgi:hypothetical protein